jgi:hypothetical protein
LPVKVKGKKVEGKEFLLSARDEGRKSGNGEEKDRSGKKRQAGFGRLPAFFMEMRPTPCYSSGLKGVRGPWERTLQGRDLYEKGIGSRKSA